MVQSFLNVLSPEQLQGILASPEVRDARQTLASGAKVAYFSFHLTDDLKQTLEERLGLNVSSLTSIPMRWIQGDTHPHIDRGTSDFTNTYLLYLHDSPGDFLIDGESYPIIQNTAYVFNEGVSHETRDTGAEPRLLIGPMNEFALPVGAPIVYFFTEADALAGNYLNIFGSSGYTVGSYNGYTQWRIASNSSGSSSQAIVYQTGDTLISDGSYNMYPAIPCFLEGTTILCHVDGKDAYVPIETLQKGALVKTSRDGYKKVELLGKGPLLNPGTEERTESRLYVCSKEVYPELSEDLILTGCHSILVDSLTEEQREQTKKHLGRVFVTDNKYRLMACIDERAKPWTTEGTFTIWHVALENKDERMNYGIYVNGGLLVESCSLNFLKNKSNMTLQ